MKKVYLTFAVFLLLSLPGIVLAQSKATIPAKNSPVRKAIIAVVKKKFGKIQKNTDNPNVLKVQGNWARIVYDVKVDGDAGSTGVNLLLKKTGSVWKIVFDYSAGGDADPDDYFKGIPRGVYNPWDN